MSFTEFVEGFLKNPEKHLHTSSSLIADAIKYFGFKIAVINGEPVIQYKIFEDPSSNGINAVYGQEFCIKNIVSTIDSMSKESGPNRGLVLVGPPASGKTNLIDLIALALENYTKEKDVRLYSFFYRFTDQDNPEKVVEIRSSFMHNPILFFTTILQNDDGIIRPRQRLFEYLNKNKKINERTFIPSYYQNASLDKRNLDILESLIQNPRNSQKTLYDIINEYVRVEEIEFNSAQANGISNIDNLKKIPVKVSSIDSREDALSILNQHLPTRLLFQYEGPLVASNRGLLHIHDAFTNSVSDEDYKPLLLLLGSGKISLETTQTSVDTVVAITTNLVDMKLLEEQLSSSKLLDRIEKIPVNYLLNAESEMEILRRDMSIIKEKYDVDPNLFRIASYYSVMTRLLPPSGKDMPAHWSSDKKKLYTSILPEQKLYLYSRPSEDPISTIRKLPYWHPFRNEVRKLNLDLYDEKNLQQYLHHSKSSFNTEGTMVFSTDDLKLIDDEFMRQLFNEHYLDEGKHGISIRQLQNIMRNTISNSDGRKILVSAFIKQLRSMIQEGSELHHWMAYDEQYTKKRKPIPSRKIGDKTLPEGYGDYGDFSALVDVVEALYHAIIRAEIIAATVDREPSQVEMDLRKYMQMALLAQAIDNKAFSHIMVPKFAFIDPMTGDKVEKPEPHFMASIEKILSQHQDCIAFRYDITQKYFDLQGNGTLNLEDEKTVIYSRRDNFTTCFEREYSILLSHRREEETIEGDLLSQAFFQKSSDPEGYMKASLEIRKITENILRNMSVRYGYSHSNALETIIYALREYVISFKEILN